MTTTEHLTAVDRDLIADVYRAARDLPLGPRPSDEDLDSFERLDLFGDCGRSDCESPEQHFPEITPEQEQAANAANAAKPPHRLFGRPRQVLPRAAHTIPARRDCHCARVVSPVGDYFWSDYGPWRDRLPIQDALRAAYNRAADLLPSALQPLIAKPWIDRDAVLATLVGTTTTTTPRQSNKEAERLNQHDVAILNAAEGQANLKTLADDARVPYSVVRKRTVRLKVMLLLRNDDGWVRTPRATSYLERTKQLA